MPPQSNNGKKKKLKKERSCQDSNLGCRNFWRESKSGVITTTLQNLFWQILLSEIVLILYIIFHFFRFKSEVISPTLLIRYRTKFVRSLCDH